MTHDHLQSPGTTAELERPDIKALCNTLYKKVQNSREVLQRDTSKRDQLMPEIDRLIAGMKLISSKMVERNDYGDYDWLERAATTWQEVFSLIFSIARNIRSEIELPPRPSNLPRSRERIEVPYTQIKARIDALAHRIGQDRKLIDMRRQIQELERNRSRIHQVSPSSEEEKDQDWYVATVHFAADVLAGRINLAYQLGADSYWQVEAVYLDDVKRLNAHYNWEARNGGWGLSGMKGDYLDACEKLRQTLLNPNIKAPGIDFADVYAYLTKNYNLDKKDFLHSGSTEELKRRKAQRIWESKSQPMQSPKQMENDWKLAEEYVGLFYGNVIPAVVEQSESKKEESMERVLKAFRRHWREYGIINCFEAAIAIYFFDPDLIRKYCGDENDIL